MRTIALVVVLAGSFVARASAHHNGAFQSSSQAETNVAQWAIAATIKNPRLGATRHTHVECYGIGVHSGTRDHPLHKHFLCVIWPWKGVGSVIYHALPAGHYVLSQRWRA